MNGKVCGIKHGDVILGSLETIEDKEGITLVIEAEPGPGLELSRTGAPGTNRAEFFFRFKKGG